MEDVKDLHALTSEEKGDVFQLLSSPCHAANDTSSLLENEGSIKVTHQIEEVKDKFVQAHISLLKASGNRCSDPENYRRFLEKRGTKREQKTAHDILLKNISSLGLEYSNPTPGNGDCFFEAVSDQLERLGYEKQSASDLRKNAVSFCRQNPIIQREEGFVKLEEFVEDGDLPSYLQKMSRKGEWADHVMVLAMALYLKTEILVVTSTSDANLEESMIRINSNGSNNDVLLLGHIYENHYQSLRPMAKHTGLNLKMPSSQNIDYERYLQAYEEVKRMRDSNINNMNRLKEILAGIIQQDKRKRIGKIVYSSVRIVGSVLVGAALATATVGVSLGLTVAGAVIGILSGGASVSHSTVKHFIVKNKCQEAEKLLNEYRTKIEEFKVLVDNLIASSQQIKPLIREHLGGFVGICIDIVKIGVEAKKLSNLRQIASAAIKGTGQSATETSGATAKDIGKGTKIASKTSKGFAKAGGVFVALSIIIDIGTIVGSGVDLHKGKLSEKAKILSNIIDELENNSELKNSSDEEENNSGDLENNTGELENNSDELDNNTDDSEVENYSAESENNSDMLKNNSAESENNSDMLKNNSDMLENNNAESENDSDMLENNTGELENNNNVLHEDNNTDDSEVKHNSADSENNSDMLENNSAESENDSDMLENNIAVSKMTAIC